MCALVNNIERLKIRHSVSPVQGAFIQSTSLENCLMGPRGEGKTEAGLVAIQHHAWHQDLAYAPFPWAVVRDTWANIERTTLQSIVRPRPGSFAAKILPYLQIRDGGHHIELPGLWELWLFGADSAADLNKLQSMQLAGGWMEETAPAAAEDIGSGLGEDVIDMIITSLRAPVMSPEAADWSEQYRGCALTPAMISEGVSIGALHQHPVSGKITKRNRRVQVTQNYPDEDHWSWRRFFDSEDPDRRLFRIPRGANKHVDDQYRRNMYNALKDKPNLLARLVEGKPAHVYTGEAVTPEYSDNHRASTVLDPVKGVKLLRSWDGGLNPSCIIWQITPSGRALILDALRGENMGMKQFIMAQVKPVLSAHYQGCTNWQDSGDPALGERDQSDSTVTAASIINAELGTTFEPGIASWEARREAVKEALNRQIDGTPMVQVSKRALILHQALSGGWHYLKTPTGAVLRDKPVKDKHSHPADAWSHHVAKIFQPQQKLSKPIPSTRKRAAGYGAKTLGGRKHAMR